MFPADLKTAKMPLIKSHVDIFREEGFENFHGHLSLRQNNQAKQFKFWQYVRTSLELIRLYVNAYKMESVTKMISVSKKWKKLRKRLLSFWSHIMKRFFEQGRGSF